MTTDASEEFPGQPDEAPGLTIDESAHLTFHGREALPLTGTEYALLLLLARNAGVTMSRDLIVEFIWSEEWHGFNHVLDVHISNLRRKLGPAARISTVRGVGYRMEAEPSIRWLNTGARQSRASPVTWDSPSPSTKTEWRTSDVRAMSGAHIVALVGLRAEILWVSSSVRSTLGWHPSRLIGRPVTQVLNIHAPAGSTRTLGPWLAGISKVASLLCADGTVRPAINISHRLVGRPTRPGRSPSRALGQPNPDEERTLGLMCEWLLPDDVGAVDMGSLPEAVTVHLARLFN